MSAAIVHFATWAVAVCDYHATAVPCDCGSNDATWHGDTMRVFCCDVCWAQRDKAEESTKP